MQLLNVNGFRLMLIHQHYVCVCALKVRNSTIDFVKLFLRHVCFLLHGDVSDCLQCLSLVAALNDAV